MTFEWPSWVDPSPFPFPVFAFLSSSKLREYLTELHIIVRTTGFTFQIDSFGWIDERTNRQTDIRSFCNRSQKQKNLYLLVSCRYGGGRCVPGSCVRTGSRRWGWGAGPWPASASGRITPAGTATPPHWPGAVPVGVPLTGRASWSPGRATPRPWSLCVNWLFHNILLTG